MSEQKIRAIETRYGGCRFRSRLEARWAVCFDRLDIAWQYEPQGYEIPGAGRYLPDFWLPTLGLWVEVKGQFRPGEWNQLVSAVEAGLPYTPGTDDPTFRPRVLLLGEVPGVDHAHHWLLTKSPSQDEVMFQACVLRVDFFFVFGPTWPAKEAADPNQLLLETVFGSERLGSAYDAARSARFEFGESG